MPPRKYVLPLVIFAAFWNLGDTRVTAAALSLEDAWEALPTYEYGQDMAALLVIDRAVIQAMASPETRSTATRRTSASGSSRPMASSSSRGGRTEGTPGIRSPDCSEPRTPTFCSRTGPFPRAASDHEPGIDPSSALPSVTRAGPRREPCRPYARA